MQAESANNQATTTGHLIAWVFAFTFFGMVLGMLCPVVYGLWLLLSSTCGTSVFGGLVIMLVGGLAGTVTAGSIGAVVGLLFGLIRLPSQTAKKATALAIMLVAIAVAVYLTLAKINLESTRAGTRAYLIDVAKAIDQYQLVNRAFPTSLKDIDLSEIENKHQVRTHRIEMEFGEAETILTYNFNDNLIEVHWPFEPQEPRPIEIE